MATDPLIWTILEALEDYLQDADVRTRHGIPDRLKVYKDSNQSLTYPSLAFVFGTVGKPGNNGRRESCKRVSVQSLHVRTQANDYRKNTKEAVTICERVGYALADPRCASGLPGVEWITAQAYEQVQPVDDDYTYIDFIITVVISYSDDEEFTES